MRSADTLALQTQRLLLLFHTNWWPVLSENVQYGSPCPQLSTHVDVCGPLGHPVFWWRNARSSQLAWSPLTGIESPQGNGGFLMQSASLPCWVSSSYTAVKYSLTECPPTCTMAGSLHTHYLGKNVWGVLISSEKKGNTFSINISLNWRLGK